MSDTLVVAVSQSGTTTDTNRTVDLARGRGAAVLAIVNRRNSDLTDKADGVMYTSDGRDVEMSVASTKAFYAQVAAGCAAGLRHRRGLRARQTQRRTSCSPRCARCPTPWSRCSPPAGHRRGRPPVRAVEALLGHRRQRPNAVAAEEVRIKLSELCYKSIACDITEDKKHIDLSSSR
jgi:glucosamine--fructose-6-phosphate aminotransferase (isomerizing)